MIQLATCILATSMVLGQAEGTPPRSEHLLALRPLLGTWTGEIELLEDVPGLGAEGDKVDVRLSYRFAKNGQAILIDVSAGGDGKSIDYTSGIIYWDPMSKKIVGVETYADGGMSRLEFERNGKEIISKSTGIKGDGTKTSATLTLTVVSPDVRKATLTDRMQGDESLPDTDPIELKRVKRAKPAAK